jgi:hypothetical protein
VRVFFFVSGVVVEEEEEEEEEEEDKKIEKLLLSLFPSFPLLTSPTIPATSSSKDFIT